MLIFSLLLMGPATFLIGCLPGYASVGVAAPVLLAVLRFVQGFGLGGEWGGGRSCLPQSTPPAAGAASTRASHRWRLCMTGALLALLWAFPMFWLFDTGNPVLITLVFSVGMVAFAVLYGPMGAYLPELFGTRPRYSGASVSYNLGGVFGGAFAPILASSILILAGGSWAISLHIALTALVSLACLFFLSETHLSDTSGMREEERELLAEGGVARK